jgi:hypothetical protein
MGQVARGCRIMCVALALGILLAACEQSLPGGTYTSKAYHFQVTYPSGWKVNISADTSASVPLLLEITRSAERTTGAPIVSKLAISVLNLSNQFVAEGATRLASNPSYHHTTLGGLPAYATMPLQQALPGANGTPTALSDTHTDYYLVHGGYEYQLSTDAVSNDNAAPALAAMLRSFAITA